MTKGNNVTDEIIQQDETITLKNLLEPSYPLLQKFRQECPGTFKHCQAVASMVEAIAIKLDLDPDILKTACLYHDIGKVINPKYFSENQSQTENPHDGLDPFISYQLISRHVSDTSLILLNDGNFPIDIIKIATQHHGTTITKYFFDKSGSEDENKFRYKGEKPSCVQSAILMICDYLEARSRSEVQSRSDFQPNILVEETINYLMRDTQLDNVTIRLGSLQTIKDTLTKELEGLYQKRIDYRKSKE